MLELKGVYKTFNAGTVNEKRAIDNLNLTLENGDFVTIIGGNGAGKSTTLNLIAGVFPVDAGTINLNGYNLTHLPEHKRAKYPRPRISGPDDGYGRDHGHRGEPRARIPPRSEARPAAPASRTRSASCTARSWRRSVWVWRTA